MGWPVWWRSSPRERGSSGVGDGLAGLVAVVPARAGVIPVTRSSCSRVRSRPRASGGHPPPGHRGTREPRSSPRERGSSHVALRDVLHRYVVPARAGVIPCRPSRRTRPRRRPRASGGHPSVVVTLDGQITSSPRERGSSGAVAAGLGRQRVVPARAGVIPLPASASTSTSCRPRASGGHPRRHGDGGYALQSSPRERGSSRLGARRLRLDRVVPARAGVIASIPSRCASSMCRPRASGGHPAAMIAAVRMVKSSPRERGSSGPAASARTCGPVVPARAGVIRGRSPSWTTLPRRPRASGGHPTRVVALGVVLMSSPRERGSSVLLRRRRREEVVVPARAGVIPMMADG